MSPEPRLVETTAGDPTAALLFTAQVEEVMERYNEDDPGPDPDPTNPTLLLYIEDEAVGCVAVAPDGKVGEIKRMFVLPSARGKGFSRLLLTAAEDLAKRSGIQTLRLETGTEQPESMNLYARSSYLPIPCYGYWKDDPTTRCFEKHLD